MSALRHLRFWRGELPLRFRAWRFRVNPWARARQCRTEADWWQRRLEECEKRR